MSGWIKIHRKIEDHWLYKNSQYLHWWIDILISANYEPKKVLVKGQLLQCNAGETLYSFDTWAKRWKVNKSAARRFLQLLENDAMIVLKNETVTTRLTVCNYDSYQTERNAPETQTKRKRNADETQTTPTKEGEERKERKEVYRAFDHLKIEQHEIDKLIQSGYTIQKIDDILDRIQNFAQNKKYKSLYLTALNWLKSDADKPTGIDKQRLQVAEGMPEHRKGLVI
jgi:hypothetical protein